MVLVDVYVPSVDKEYDFNLDTKTPVEIIVAEIGEMVGQKEHCNIVGNVENLMLCDRDRNTILPRKNTLEECAVVTGSRLLLV